MSRGDGMPGAVEMLGLFALMFAVLVGAPVFCMWMEHQERMAGVAPVTSGGR